MYKKIAENLKNRLDSHDKLWYPVVTARLVKSNQGCETLCKGFRFLHSILSFSWQDAAFWFALHPLRGTQGSGTALCADENKNGTLSLTT